MTSWALARRITEVAWKVVQVPFWVWDRVLPGTFGTRCGERKRNVWFRGGNHRAPERQHVTLFVWSRWTETVAPQEDFCRVFLVLTPLGLLTATQGVLFMAVSESLCITHTALKRQWFLVGDVGDKRTGIKSQDSYSWGRIVLTAREGTNNFE